MPSPNKLGSTRVVAAVPGALTAVLLVGAVAFGASTLRSAAPATDAAAPATESAAPLAKPAGAAAPASKPRISLAIDLDNADPKPTATPAKPKPAATPKPAPSPEEETKQLEQPVATAKPQPAPAPPKATDKPKPAPAPAPVEPVALVLEGWQKDGKVKLAWKPYAHEGFEYYKVVRSTDATVTWPAGADDTVIGVIGDRNAPWWADKPACGVASSYGVFAVRAGDGGYVTLGASNVVTLTVPCAPDPTHETKPIGLWAEARSGEGVKLVWDACAVDGFIAYKVVRSLTNPDPRYPLNDGTELIAAIGDSGQTHLLDAAVTAGQSWTYRVLAVGEGSSGKIILCQSAAVAATAP